MKAYRLRIVLRHVKPEVYRVVMVPAGITFLRLHDVIQFAMGWQDYHLYMFSFEGEKEAFTNSEELVDEYKFYLENPKAENPEHQLWIDLILKRPFRLSSKVKIDKYMEKHGRAVYTYDFGDNWEHDIILEEVVDDYPFGYPQCIDWSGACPPEDVGGPGGYVEFLKAWRKPTNKEKRQLVEWGKSQGFKEQLDLQQLNRLYAWSLVLKRPKRRNAEETE